MTSQEKRFQIFVSSTYTDLIDERRAVLEAIASLRHIAVGMEYFAAATVPPWDYIKDAIDDCDYYVLILGGRYGSLSADGISFTEREYDYAVSKSKPIIALLHQNPEHLPRNRTAESDSAWEKLQKFRAKVADSRTCSFWKTPDELQRKAAIGLMSEFQRSPARGWIRPAGESPSQRSQQESSALPPIRDMTEILQRTLSLLGGADTTYMPSGIPHLDDVIGGLRPGTVVLAAGRPSMGLTTLAVNVVASVAKMGLPVLAFVPSTTPEEFTSRYLSCLAGVQVKQDFSGLADAEFQAVAHAIKTLDNAPLRIDDSRSHTFETFALRCRSEKKICGALPLITVDSLNFLDSLATKTDVGRALKSLALELESCILITSHLGREVEAKPDKRPTLRFLGQAQSIGEEADVILLLYRPELFGLPDPKSGSLEIFVAKNKLGQVAVLKVACIFSSAQMMPVPKQPSQSDSVSEDDF